jgi:DNA-binding NarL/FixJ family response regulator
VPYEHAQSRVLLASAYTALGDADGAQLELDAARSTFQTLGAAAALGALGVGPSAIHERPEGLTPRELEILGHLAKGKTNAAIAADLVISERTVESHVRSIFMKIGVSTRAAATAYAYERGLAAST